MKNQFSLSSILILMLVSMSCAGLKVINPNEQNKNSGNLAVDFKDGKLDLVATYSCKLESMGKRVSATGKTEDEARKEVIARCHDNTLFSFCDPKSVKCTKN